MKTNFKTMGKLLLLGAIAITINGNVNAKERFDDTTHEFGSNITNTVDEVKVIGTDDTNENNGYAILDTIQTAINWVLGMLSLIALVLCLRGGFQMLIAGGDDSKVKSGTKVLKNAAIGLAVIGLAWLIVSFVFRIINKTTGTA